MRAATSRSCASASEPAGASVAALDRRGLLLGRRQRLGHLAVVPVDGHRLDAQAPGVDVQLLHVLDRHVLGHVDRLGDGAADEGLHRPHHADVARVVDGVVAHGAGEDGQVLGGQVRRAEDRHVLVDVGDDVLGLLDPVAQLGQRPRHRLVDDRHGAAADQLLGLDQTEVGLDAGRVAVHQQADGPGRRQHRWPASCARRRPRPGRPPGPRPPGPRRAARAARRPRRCGPPRPGACAAR